MVYLSIINHLLHQSPEVREGLREYAARSFGVCYLGQTREAVITEEGFLQNAHAPTEVRITLVQSAALKIIKQQTPEASDVTIEGDHDLALAILPLLGALRYEPEADLIRLFGGQWGSFLANRLLDAKTHMGQLKQSIVEQISDYAYENSSLLVHQQDFTHWSDDVNCLKDDLEKLHTRAGKLHS